MEREIKFRAFRKSTSEMYDELAIGEGWINKFFREMPGYPDRNDYILMQFTGLHDKNGRKIYEGDILAPCGIWIDEPTAVSFENGAFGLDGHSFDYGFEELNWCNLEIIGNIYEHPEFIRGEDK